MEVREAATKDAESIRRVHRASIEGLGPAAYDPEQVTAWAAGCKSADYSKPIESYGVHFVVAEQAGDIFGFGSLSFDASTEYEASVDAEVTGIYVHPSKARAGVGTELLTILERKARERGVETLGLSASRNAVPFYASHGYERVRVYEHEFSGHTSTGVTGNIVEMTKTIG